MVTLPFWSTISVPSLKATDFRAFLSVMGTSCTLALLEPKLVVCERLRWGEMSEYIGWVTYIARHDCG
jgi:hypothetical protein